jgi:hypothetical protein
MKCQECELLLADEQRTPEVEDHLAACAACKSFAHELHANFEALGEMRDELPPIPVRRWRAYAMAAAAVIVVGVGIAYHLAQHEVRQPVTIAVNPPAIVRAVEKRETEPAMPMPRRRRVAPVKNTGDQQELMVKMETEDPEVVIYWLVEPEKGQ